jgi:hypothetical protein
MEDDFLADNLLVHIEDETYFELEHFQNRFVVCRPSPPRTLVKLRLSAMLTLSTANKLNGNSNMS